MKLLAIGLMLVALGCGGRTEVVKDVVTAQIAVIDVDQETTRTSVPTIPDDLQSQPRSNAQQKPTGNSLPGQIVIRTVPDMVAEQKQVIRDRGGRMSSDVEPRSRVWDHLINEHGFTRQQVMGLSQYDALVLHDFAHENDIYAEGFPSQKVVAQPVTAPETYPRLILITDPSYCTPCRTQETILEDFKKWDKAGLWKIGETPDCHIQVLDDSMASQYGVTSIPAWVRVSRSGTTTVTGVLTKEQIVNFHHGTPPR